MKQYRIAERKFLKETKYIVQRKHWLWGWKDETFFTSGDEWLGYGEFDTLEEAQKYISWETNPKERIL